MSEPLIRNGKLVGTAVKAIDKLDLSQKSRLHALMAKDSLTGAEARELLELRKAAAK